MNQSEDFGKILKPWPNLVDHFISGPSQYTTSSRNALHLQEKVISNSICEPNSLLNSNLDKVYRLSY